MKKPIVILAVFELAITLTPSAFCDAPADYRFAYGYGRVWGLG